jgi:hypothetical protein
LALSFLEQNKKSVDTEFANIKNPTCDNSSRWYFGIIYELWMLSIFWIMLRHDLMMIYEFLSMLWKLKIVVRFIDFMTCLKMKWEGSDAYVHDSMSIMNMWNDEMSIA